MERDRIIALRDFLVDRHTRPAAQLMKEAAKRFGIAVPSVRYHVRELLRTGYLVASGNTKARRYSLPRQSLAQGTIEISADTEDDFIWAEIVRPALKDMNASPNLTDICRYGCTEMLNNVIDHSGSATCNYDLYTDPRSLTLAIWDKGVGIFEKIKRDCGLVDHRQALLELSKGKFSSDPQRHTGEGIFFTSRMFDRFLMCSGTLNFVRMRDGENWLIEDSATDEPTLGTYIMMEAKHDTPVRPEEVFRRFEDDGPRFAKTHVPVALGKYPEDELVSRSQARRLMMRVEKFSDVRLDFDGIASIGQAFADEVFRVWAKEHPETRIEVTNASDDVWRMIKRVTTAN